jgi:hypothetical protein
MLVTIKVLELTKQINIIVMNNDNYDVVINKYLLIFFNYTLIRMQN